MFPSIPEIVTFGNSLDEARRAAHEALRCHIEGLLKDGDYIPIESKSVSSPYQRDGRRHLTLCRRVFRSSRPRRLSERYRGPVFLFTSP